MRTSARLAAVSLVIGIPATVFWACSSPELPPTLQDTDAALPRPDVLQMPDVLEAGADVLPCRGADGGCNNLTVCGAQVPIVVVNATLPVATGGLVQDGTYVLTGYTAYANTPPFGPTQDWFRETMTIAGSQVQLADEHSGGSGITTTSITISYGYPDGGTPPDAAAFDAGDGGDGGDAGSVPAPNFMAYKYTCSPATLAGVPYSVNGSQLMIDVIGGQKPARLTYVKQ
jgi:hypothetical protein